MNCIPTRFYHINKPYLVPDSQDNGQLMFRSVRYLREAEINFSKEGVSHLFRKAILITGIALSVLALGYGIYLIVEGVKEKKRQEKYLIYNCRIGKSPSMEYVCNKEKQAQNLREEQARLAKEQQEQLAKQKKEQEQEQERLAQIEYLKQQNILIVGRSRAGKSNIANLVKDLLYTGPRTTAFIPTEYPELHTTTIDSCTLRLLDTPGVFEIDNIKKIASQNFGGEGFEKVNTVIMTVPQASAVNPDDIKFLELFLPLFKSGVKKLFVVTRTEDFSEERRKHLKSAIKDDDQLSRLVDEHFGGPDQILLGGELNEDNTQVTLDGEAKELFERIQNIHKYREALIKALLPFKENEEHFEKRDKALCTQVNDYMIVKEKELQSQLL